VSPTAIALLVPRRRATLVGVIRAVVSYERPYPRTEAELDDGTGIVTLRFVGRPLVPGLAVGRRLIAEGTPGPGCGGGLLILNPLYRFDPEPEE
jgi:hypothetical protein